MASNPTQNPVPSENYDDLRFNAGKLDEFVTSPENSYTDRLGVAHLTARGLQNSVAGALLPENNLSDLEDKETSLANLGGASAGIAVFKAGTPAAARAAISSAGSGLNGDITEITGLTTALSVAQGGTGGKTASAARTNLGIGTLGTQNASTVSITGGSITGINDLPIADGGTGASSAATARANLGAKADTGVTDASNASSGQVGEIITAISASSAITSGTATNLVSIALTAGDWDVSSIARYDPSAASITGAVSGINTTSATQPSFPDCSQIGGLSASSTVQISSPLKRLNLSVTTTVYLVGIVNFSSGTATSRGFIQARRVR